MRAQPVQQPLGALLRPGKVGGEDFERHAARPVPGGRGARRLLLQHGGVQLPEAPAELPHPLQAPLRQAAERPGPPVLCERARIYTYGMISSLAA